MRQIKDENMTRLVISGLQNAPTTIYVEYRVVDGDLAEDPQRLALSNIQWSTPIGTVWGSAIAAVKTAEELG